MEDGERGEEAAKGATAEFGDSKACGELSASGRAEQALQETEEAAIELLEATDGKGSSLPQQDQK